MAAWPITCLIAACLSAAGGTEEQAVVGDTAPAPRRKGPDVSAVLKLARRAPPLPPPTEPIVRVGTADELYEAVTRAKPGTTILLADGVYRLGPQPVIRADRVTVRGASGDRDKVILDRGGSRRRAACLMVSGADDVLIADLTCRNSPGMGVHVQPHIGAQRTRIYNVKFHNIWTRGVKGSHPKLGYEPVGAHRAEILRKRPTGGEIRYCLFVNDRPKASARDGFGGDYVAGIDMMWLKDWVIADNVFVGIRGRNGGGRGAIFIWVHSEDVVAERNIIIHCDRGICFGNPSGSRPHMTRGIARNNFIVGGAGKPIEMCRTVDTKVYNNTVVAASATYPYGAHFFQGSEGGRFINNLVHGRVALAKTVESAHNVVGDLTGWFVKPAIGDLHLTGKAKGALAAAAPLPEVTEDFDRQKRKPRPDVGADEQGPARPGG